MTAIKCIPSGGVKQAREDGMVLDGWWNLMSVWTRRFVFLLLSEKKGKMFLVVVEFCIIFVSIQF